MPYKDPLKQKEAQARHYKINKDQYQNRTSGRAARNRMWLNEYKKSCKCERCPENDPRCLDFHHKDGSTKRETVSTMAQKGYGLESLMEEVKKCTCLCANCHRKEHNGNVWQEDSRGRSSIG